MSSRHSLLERQLRKFFPTGTSERAVAFIEAVDRAYHQFDDDRRMLERTLDLSSQELIQANRDLRRNVSLLQSTFESTADGILVVDGNRRIISYNQRLAQMWQLSAEVLAHHDDDLVLEHVMGLLRHPDPFLAKVRELYSSPLAESFDVIELTDGRVFERYSIPQKIDGVPVGRVWSFRDITARKKAEEQLLHDAIHDGLTALPNRTLFLDRLEHAIRRSQRALKHVFALLFVDLDRFKVVNDSLGHLAGDELLVSLADRLRACVRPADTVARLGGDEFTILLDVIAHPEEAIIAAERIQRAVAAPFNIRGTEIFTTASIGIAVSAPHYVQPEEMLRDADIAMYRAKAKGRAGYEVFQPGMHTSAVALLHLENDLRRAVKRGELVLHYQPVVSLSEARILGFEALLRWNHPSRGLLQPADFVPIAEETGLIVAIGRWALREACGRMREWQQYFGRSDLSISVNLSGRQLVDPALILEVEHALLESELPPGSLCLELTETVLMENSQAAMRTLAQLRGLGVSVHIDDFGTGYSSLGYLHRFPVDAIKIDRSFISHIETGDENLDIIRTIMTLATNLKMTVIAEGVENEMQRAQLVALGCQAAQGFLFSEAADILAVRTMIGSGHWSGHAV